MTTFSFSVHIAPDGARWPDEFGPGRSTSEIVDLEALGLGGWEGHRLFIEWVRREAIEKHESDFNKYVVKCSREQLDRFIQACELARQLPDKTSVDSLLDGSGSRTFVLRLWEF